ncbi:homeobox protein Hox-A5 [Striga asiatica]|uniref:Homeobox protein Hox-A5 n=1 Tax=Striga asiatica TaxID=4170 RepID=A0A5A7QZK0_STRAF|nr:homeobox protein Hox-A5 [Striga asiatica]
MTTCSSYDDVLHRYNITVDHRKQAPRATASASPAATSKGVCISGGCKQRLSVVSFVCPRRSQTSNYLRRLVLDIRPPSPSLHHSAIRPPPLPCSTVPSPKASLCDGGCCSLGYGASAADDSGSAEEMVTTTGMVARDMKNVTNGKMGKYKGEKKTKSCCVTPPLLKM